jgi:hypothetical protein
MLQNLEETGCENINWIKIGDSMDYDNIEFDQ